MPKNSFTVDGKPEMNSSKPETYQLCFDTIMKGKVGLWKLSARRVGWCLVLGWLLCRVHCGLIVAVQGEIDKGSHYTIVCVDVSLLESSDVF